MNYSKLAVTAAIWVALCATALGHTQAQAETIDISGETRSYILDGATSNPKPLIIALHGGGGSAERFRRRSGLLEATGDNFALVWPESADGNWNDGRVNRRGALVTDTNDEAFILGLVKALVAQRIADPKRIYVVGHSNGGMMSFALGCRHPNVFRGIAPVSANIPEPMNCAGSGAIALLNIVGLEDRVVPFEGGGVFGRKRRGGLKSVEETLEIMASRNGCSTVKPTETEATITWSGQGCKAPTVQTRINGAGHAWPEDPVNAAKSVVTFFSQH